MRRFKKKFWIIGLLFLVVVGGCHLWGGPFYYYAGPIRATVIDEETGRPVRGAVVAAVWMLDVLGIDVAFWIHADETVTNAKGEFTIPGWGPKLRPPLHWFDDEDPTIFIYKPGYKFARLNNNPAYVPVIRFYDNGRYVGRQAIEIQPDQIPFEGKYSRSAKRFCYWNGKTVALESARSSEYEADALDEVRFWFNSDAFALPADEFPVVWAKWLEGWQRLPPQLRPGVPTEAQKFINRMSRN